MPLDPTDNKPDSKKDILAWYQSAYDGYLIRYAVPKAFPPDQLNHFSPKEALRRYKACEREVCPSWLKWAHCGFWILLPLILLATVILANNSRLEWLMLACEWLALILSIVIASRIKRRLRTRIAAELNDGRMSTCLDCGYDLRASHGETCPECGAGIRVDTKHSRGL